MTDRWTRNTFDDNKKLTVVNFFGGAGVGKSTTAAELFALMKKQGFKVELIHEVAKDLVWEELYQIFGEQDYIFALQHRLIRRLTRHDIDYAIVDSSILLSLFYMPDDYPKSFCPFVVDVFNSYDNVNIFLERSDDIPYVQEGRNETEEQAKAKDTMIHKYFVETGTPIFSIKAGNFAPFECLTRVKEHKKPQ